MEGGSQDFRQTIWDWENGKRGRLDRARRWAERGIVRTFDSTGSLVATNGVQWTS
jgi:hypothetical protein